jgi:hypothetical protein
VITLDYVKNIAYYTRIGRGRSRLFHLTPVIEEYTLTPTIGGNVTWLSSDENVATVENGVVTKVSDACAVTYANGDNLQTEAWVVK